MRLKGSCHCRAVRFSVRSAHPYPYNLCYCSICRKTAGSGGYAINLSGEFETLNVEGRDHITVYRARRRDEETGEETLSHCERSFCRLCGSNLWVWSSMWPELLHPFASAVDSPLPRPPERTHLMLGSRADWVQLRTDPRDRMYDAYPEESIAQWHRRLGLETQDREQ
ncbi:MAG: GFA family protein [Proteobacteria bacterium]|nr:GFA family protein [Pseudomonadota bacterium]MYJ95306.1 GFA family protein [Pseudomonadota bacterium]